jgi:signal transduction histidine kinase
MRCTNASITCPFFSRPGVTAWLFDLGRRQQQRLLEQAERLRRADRLALMGSLAGGLAHEIRNPLQSLLGAADMEMAREGHLFVTLSNQGSGIAAEARPKVFGPFFTTKAKGTGLRLALSRFILEAHGGGLSSKQVAELDRRLGATWRPWCKLGPFVRTCTIASV